MFNASFMFSRAYRLSLSAYVPLSVSRASAANANAFVRSGGVEFLTGIFFLGYTRKYIIIKQQYRIINT